MLLFPSPPLHPRALVGRRIFSFHTGEGVRAFWKRSQNESTYTNYNTRWHTKELMFTPRALCATTPAGGRGCMRYSAVSTRGVGGRIFRFVKATLSRFPTAFCARVNGRVPYTP